MQGENQEFITGLQLLGSVDLFTEKLKGDLFLKGIPKADSAKCFT